MSQIIAMKMKELRKRFDLTGEEIGRRAQVSRSYIARIESGEIPSLEFAFKIEKALGLVGELSNLVIEAARQAVGLSEAPAAAHHHQPALSSATLESLCLSQACPSCGGKVKLQIGFTLSQASTLS